MPYDQYQINQSSYNYFTDDFPVFTLYMLK